MLLNAENALGVTGAVGFGAIVFGLDTGRGFLGEKDGAAAESDWSLLNGGWLLPETDEEAESTMAVTDNDPRLLSTSLWEPRDWAWELLFSAKLLLRFSLASVG